MISTQPTGSSPGPAVPNELPVDLAPPLHLMEPGGPSFWWLLLPLLALILGFWWRSRRTPTAPPPAPTPLQFAPVITSNLARDIDALHERYKDEKDLRRGCHELAKLLRHHVAGTMHLTAREITNRMGDTPIGRLFPMLAELQFSRNEPRRSDFTGICELAQESALKEAQEK